MLVESNLAHLYLAARFGVTPLEFRWDLWHQKTKIPGVSYGAVCVILCLAVLVLYRRLTDGRTHNDSIYRASLASRGKNVNGAHVLCYGGLIRDILNISTKGEPTTGRKRLHMMTDTTVKRQYETVKTRLEIR